MGEKILLPVCIEWDKKQALTLLNLFSVLYSEGLAPKNPMLPSAGTLDNVTKTIGRLLDGYDIRLRPNFGGEYEKTIKKHTWTIGPHLNII